MSLNDYTGPPPVEVDVLECEYFPPGHPFYDGDGCGWKGYSSSHPGLKKCPECGKELIEITEMIWL